MAPHLLVTNDFPPKVGGIQTYLWELWRRLPSENVIVLTTPHEDAAAFDATQPYRIVRTKEPVLLPTPSLKRRIEALRDEVGARLVVLDPAVPVGLVGPALGAPYAVVLHGSELIGRIPTGGSQAMGEVVKRAVHVIAAGNYPASEARRVGGDRTPPITVIPPGVDIERFRPASDDDERRSTRRRFGIDEDAELVLGLSRLVPRKGFDVLIEAAAALRSRHPNLRLAIGGSGSDHDRVQKRIDATGAPATLLGRVADDDLPALYATADVFAMCCRTRWGGLEPEGFGIVFLEAAACGVPQLAGDSGGAADAVVHGETGLVVGNPRDTAAVAEALAALLDDPEKRRTFGRASRERAVAAFTYDHLAARLAGVLDGLA
ncbi:MAG TPA: glycosyltransferase family 4 protein [Acidimicrobiales bacterium]|nr:glycosyltransferase family 4 protein [Acidimicrobiales bacterium]